MNETYSVYLVYFLQLYMFWMHTSGCHYNL